MASFPEGPLNLPAESDLEAKTHNDEGILHYKEGHFDIALKHFREAGKIQSEIGEIHFNEAISLDKLGDHGAATKHFKVAQEKANGNKLILEVIYPTIEYVNNLFDSGKIGAAEQNLLRTTISKSLNIFNQISIAADPKKNVVVIAADPDSILISESASASYHSDGWNVSHLGDMSSAINVLFDLDFQKLVGKIWKQKPGVLLIVIFSQTSEGLTFFADSINPNKKKSDKFMKLALCGNISKKTKINSDLLSDKIGDILQWSNTISENLK